MQLFCSVPSVPLYSLASKLRHRLLRASALPTRAAASVRASVRSFHFNHRPAVEAGSCGDKHVPRPAALGTVAVMGQMRDKVMSHMENACMGERVRFRQHISNIHQHWENGSFLFQSSNRYS